MWFKKKPLKILNELLDDIKQLSSKDRELYDKFSTVLKNFEKIWWKSRVSVKREDNLYYYSKDNVDLYFVYIEGVWVITNIYFTEWELHYETIQAHVHRQKLRTVREVVANESN